MDSAGTPLSMGLARSCRTAWRAICSGAGRRSSYDDARSNRQISVIGFALLAVAASGALLALRTEAHQSQVRQYSLESAAGLRLRNLTAQPATLQGKKGLQITSSGVEEVAAIDGLEFDNGLIEAELAGAPGAGAGEGARGFVGIAFRVQQDTQTFDAFYLRPTNGRAEDQERRNHANAVHLTPRLAMVPSSQRDPVKI